MKFFLAITSIILLNFTSLKAQKNNYGRLQNGDLLFQDLDCGGLCDAIEQVTISYGGRHFSHIGLVSIQGDSVFVIEAIGSKVQQTSLNVFVQRSQNEILVGRVKRRYKNVALAAVAMAKQNLGISYDDGFIYDNGKYYCSELLYDAFKQANGAKDFFELRPMTFKKPHTNEFFPVWEEYYQKLGMLIPEGMPGINPGGISMSKKLKMFRYRKD